jgi:hypothetical protein
MSESIDGINYNFVTTDQKTVTVVGNTATYSNLVLKQGIPTSLTFQVNLTTNPATMFEIPEVLVDISTLDVVVQESFSNTSTTTYTQAIDYLSLDDTSTVYFLQENTKGSYELYFGDGVIGKKLTEGNIVRLSYLITQGSAAAGANNFVLMDPISGYSNHTLFPISSASQGSNRESIESIKFQAPKHYAAQKRAVTKEDYITIIQRNKFNIPVQSVSIWGGEENDPPKYGAIYAAIKPTGDYYLTDYQKQVLIDDVIKPISVMTVTPEIIDPDYVYLTLTSEILYDVKKTTLTAAQIEAVVKQGVIQFTNANLNTFNSTFVVGDLIAYIKTLNTAIVGVDFDVFLQKRIIPSLNKSLDYTIKFSNTIEQTLGAKQVQIIPSFSQYDSDGTLIENIYFEESLDFPGTLKTYYYLNGVKYILHNSNESDNAGTIDYINGTITLNNFVPNTINAADGVLRINATAASRIVSTAYNRILTLDEFDPVAITVNVTSK